MADRDEIQPSEPETEPENFNGRLAENIRPDFYVVMTVPDIGRQSERSEQEGRGGKRKEWIEFG
jgi:hypothetical protein